VVAVDFDRTLAVSPFPGDAGEANGHTRECLAQARLHPTPQAYLGAVAALCTDRLLVPVVATATRFAEAAERALSSDKEAEMSVVGVQGPDGRRALLAFTGLDSLQAWDARARPVPVTLDVAAQSALADGAAALLLDVAGPHPLVIEGEVLSGLARGHRMVDLGNAEFGWVVAAE
jgi:hypothetical protein